MAVKVKPLSENEPGSEPITPVLAHFPLKPLSVVVGTSPPLGMTHKECHDMQQVLGVLLEASQHAKELGSDYEVCMSVEEDIPFETKGSRPQLKLVVNPEPPTDGEDDDSDAYARWKDAYMPFPFKNVCWLEDREKHILRTEGSARVRSIKGKKPAPIGEAYVTDNPVEGWWGQRPPTLDQLYTHSQQMAVLAEQQVSDKKAARRQERKDATLKWAAESAAKREAAAKVNPAPVVVPQEYTANPVAVYEAQLESQRLRSWMLLNTSEYYPDKRANLTGLQRFFLTTGIPVNNDRAYREYWDAQSRASQRFSPERLLAMYYEMSGEDHYEEWWDQLAEIDQQASLDKWLLEHWATGNTFLPENRAHHNSSIFQRKMNAFTMALERSVDTTPGKHEAMEKLWKHLFVPEEPVHLAHTRYGKQRAEKVAPVTQQRQQVGFYLPEGRAYPAGPAQEEATFYPMVAVGEPYGDYSRDEKVEAIRESLLSEAANDAKVRAVQALPPMEEDDLVARLNLRMTDMLLAEERVRKIIREELDDYTAAMVAEFTVAMEDCVERVVANAAKVISSAKKSSVWEDLYGSPAPKGYAYNPDGIITPG